MLNDLTKLIKSVYGDKEVYPLHEPCIKGNEKKYVNDAIDSTFVSSVGAYVDDFEKKIASIAGTDHAVATVNGTAALQVALKLSGVESDTEVITQPLTFVATSNGIKYTGADPVFVDISEDTLGMSPRALKKFLDEHIELNEESLPINTLTNKKVTACVPMHTFGFPCEIEEIIEVCDSYNIPVVEDAAESLGSYKGGKHTGSFGQSGIFSFNGNKIVTAGGGGAIVTNDQELAKKAKHITTTAKVPGTRDYYHDMTGYNYRMPNLNAAFVCAQLEMLDEFIDFKRNLASKYSDFFISSGHHFFNEPENTGSNYWLNTVIAPNKKEREQALDHLNDNKILARPAWILMNELPMYKDCICGDLQTADELQGRIYNLPSGVNKG
ncbi:MAG: LegC family aminotransferase [Flavobacteriales bacterium]